MSYLVRFNDADNDVLEVNQSADTSQYLGKPHCAINPDLSAVVLIDKKYWKLVSGNIQAMTLAERQAKDDAQQTALRNSVRLSAKQSLVGFGKEQIFYRAVIRVLVEAINAPTPMTLAEVIGAIRAEIDSGGADT